MNVARWLERAAERAPGKIAAISEGTYTDCRSKIAAFKVPRIVEMVRELPKTATGKILRRSLREHTQAS